MKLILQRATLFFIVAFIAFTLVLGTRIIYQRISKNDQQLQDCFVVPSLVNNNKINPLCTNKSKHIVSPKSVYAPTVNQNLTKKEQFVAEIANKLLIFPQAGSYEYILLSVYGAVFINQNPEIKLPPKVFFADENETEVFQSTLTLGKVIGAKNCYLQKAAADALNQAKTQVNIPFKSGYGASDCTRSFTTTERFWRKYANDKTLDQVREGKQKRILGIVAPPGASQHLWGLAVDLRVSTEVQKQVLYQNGWYQTVENDAPHWTYLGLPPDQLLDLGFNNKIVKGVNYWLTPL